MQLSERLVCPISTAELERRWNAVRKAMEAEKIDVLLMQNNVDQMGGYVKYFTDFNAVNGYPQTVVFPRDADMTLIGQGPFGMVKELPHEGDGVRRGVKTWATTPSYSSAHTPPPMTPSSPPRRSRPTRAAPSAWSAPTRCRSGWSTTCATAATRTASSSRRASWS